MAKVTITLEDIQTEDGSPAIRAGVESDDKSDEVTMAESLAAELFQVIKDLAPASPARRSENESLN